VSRGLGWRAAAPTYAEYRQLVDGELARAYAEGVPMDRERAARLVIREVARDRRGRPGIAKPRRCERCGKECKASGLHGHHLDYARPLHVLWLCAACHRSVHLGSRLLIEEAPMEPTRSY
jgi:hypothetical protein